MDTTGIVTSLEKVGAKKAVIFKGLLDIRAGQTLRRGSQTWVVLEKRWVRKPHISLFLNPVGNTQALPDVDWSLELVHDAVEGQNVVPEVDDLTVETTVAFSKHTLLCCRGVLAVDPGDVLTDGKDTWKVLEQSDSLPVTLGKRWLSVKNGQGTDFPPAVNAKLLKKD